MIFVALDFFALQPRARRDVNFATDDGFDAFGARGLIKFDDPVHRAVIGDGERGEFQLVRPFHQFIQATRAIEQ